MYYEKHPSSDNGFIFMMPNMHIDFTWPLHIHKNYEFIFVEEGALIAEINGFEYKLCKGEGAFILSNENKSSSSAYIDNVMIGKIVDGLTTDGANMGPAMARAAFDSIYTYLSISGDSPENFDKIITGDLGATGSDILRDMLKRECPGAEKIHEDCGMLLYDFKKKNTNSGASGCGCSASVLSNHYLPLIESGKYKNVLFLSTGALMNPASLLQGENILGIAPIVNIRSCS